MLGFYLGYNFGIQAPPQEEFVKWDRERQEKYYEAMKDLEFDVENRPLRYFVPNEPQLNMNLQFCNMFDTGCRFFFQPCGNRTGKTTNIIALVAALVTGSKDGFFELMPDWPYAKKIWIVAEAKNVDENLEDILLKYIKGSNYTPLRKNKSYYSEYVFHDTGWEINIRTFDMDLKSFESSTVGLVVCDEPPTYEIYTRLIGRIIQGGAILMGATPLYGAGWMADELVEPAELGNPKHYSEPASVYKNVLELAGEYTHDEIIGHGFSEELAKRMAGQKKGNISLESVETAIEKMDEKEVEARIEGKFLFLSGRIISNYSQKRQFIKPFAFNVNEYELYCMMDPHTRRPNFLTWIIVDARGKKFVVDEWPNLHNPQAIIDNQIKYENLVGVPYEKIDAFAGDYRDIGFVIKQREEELGFSRRQDAVFRIIDPNFGQTKIPAKGHTVIDEFAEIAVDVDYPLYFNKGVNDLNTGIQLIKSANKLDNWGDPDLYIFNTCDNTDRALRRWKYKEFKGVAQEGQGLSEKVEELHKDPIDNLRYFFATKPVHEEETSTPLERSIQKRVRKTRGAIGKEDGLVR